MLERLNKFTTASDGASMNVTDVNYSAPCQWADGGGGGFINPDQGLLHFSNFLDSTRLGRTPRAREDH